MIGYHLSWWVNKIGWIPIWPFAVARTFRGNLIQLLSRSNCSINPINCDSVPKPLKDLLQRFSRLMILSFATVTLMWIVDIYTKLRMRLSHIYFNTWLRVACKLLPDSHRRPRMFLLQTYCRGSPIFENLRKIAIDEAERLKRLTFSLWFVLLSKLYGMVLGIY